MRKRKSLEVAEVVNPLRDFHGNRFERAVAQGFYWVRQRARTVLILAGTLVALAVALVIVFVVREQRQKQGLIAFEVLMKNPIMAPNSGAEKVAIEKLEKYEKEYSDYHSRMRAGQKKADLQLKSKQSEPAAETLLGLAKLAEAAEIGALFAYRAGVIFEEEKKYSRAEEAYSLAVGKIQDENGPAALAMFGQGRMLIMLGKVQEGRTVLKKMMEMKEVENIADLKLAAVAFLLQNVR